MAKRICISINESLHSICKGQIKSKKQSFSALVAEALLEKLFQVKKNESS